MYFTPEGFSENQNCINMSLILISLDLQELNTIFTYNKNEIFFMQAKKEIAILSANESDQNYIIEPI